MTRIIAFAYFTDGPVDNIAVIETTSDRFLEFNKGHFWPAWDYLCEDMQIDGCSPDHIARLKKSCPMWFIDNHEDRQL